ncbi:ESPR domain-containing protein [Histophilus somni]|nr:ESPR domain-containing protein [Histophilus somni]
MNKIFKTKYDVTTGQTKVVSELANNRQVASRVEGASGRWASANSYGLWSIGKIRRKYCFR